MDALLELMKRQEEDRAAMAQEIAQAQVWLEQSRQVRRADLRRRLKLLRSRAVRAKLLQRKAKK